MVPSKEWPTTLTVASAADKAEMRVEFGQTNIVDANETRIHPTLVAERESLLLFTPSPSLEASLPLPKDATLLAGVFESSSASAAPLGPPLTLYAPNSTSLQTMLMEQELTSEVLPPYSTTAWASVLPWQYIKEGAELRIVMSGGGAASEGGGVLLYTHALIDLGAPHQFHLTRNKLLLFGTPEQAAAMDTDTSYNATLGYDYFPTLPFSSLSWVDTTPVTWPYIVEATPSGARRAYGETERVAMGAPADHWDIIKEQYTRRLELAHVGLGLVHTHHWGLSSPYSAGTTMALGWYYDDSPGQLKYRDLADIGVAAGWTGWSTLWTGHDAECGTVMTHELGHAMTMAHFTEGTAVSWGIDEEYPSDGTYVSLCCDPDDGSHEGHPWPYDSLRRRIASWYYVTKAGGPEWLNQTAGVRKGKADPMNSGDHDEELTCFPHYTPYHTRKAQQWAEDGKTHRTIDGVASWYQWDPTTKSYLPVAPEAYGQAVLDTDVPTVTLIGTLGNNTAEACQIYPTVFTRSAPIFELPSAFASSGLPSSVDPYHNAQYYLIIEYDDGVVSPYNETALIAEPLIAPLDAKRHSFSVNLDARKVPKMVHLVQPEAAYPYILPSTPFTVLFSREVTPIPPSSTPSLEYGHGDLGNGIGITIQRLCEPTHPTDCDELGASSGGPYYEDTARLPIPTWRAPPTSELFFSTSSSGASPATCGAATAHVEFTVPVVHDVSGASYTLYVHGQKELVLLNGASRRAPMDDVTPWYGEPNVETRLRLWAPIERNSHLTGLPGLFRTSVTSPPLLYSYVRHAQGVIEPHAVLPVHIQLTIPAVVPIAFVDGTVWTSPIVHLNTTSSIYFVVRDAAIGPTSGTWWGGSGPTALMVPVIKGGDATSAASLVLQAQRLSCNPNSPIEFNAGRVSSEWDCDHKVKLVANAADNPNLAPGLNYSTMSTKPLVIDAYNWHGTSVIQATFHLAITCEEQWGCVLELLVSSGSVQVDAQAVLLDEAASADTVASVTANAQSLVATTPASLSTTLGITVLAVTTPQVTIETGVVVPIIVANAPPPPADGDGAVPVGVLIVIAVLVAVLVPAVVWYFKMRRAARPRVAMAMSASKGGKQGGGKLQGVATASSVGTELA